MNIDPPVACLPNAVATNHHSPRRFAHPVGMNGVPGEGNVVAHALEFRIKQVPGSILIVDCMGELACSPVCQVVGLTPPNNLRRDFYVPCEKSCLALEWRSTLVKVFGGLLQRDFRVSV